MSGALANRQSQRSWLHDLLRELSDAGRRLTQVDLQDIAEEELGHPFPKYTARMSELRDELFPTEAIFAERVEGTAGEVWEYWIGPMTTDARDRYLENRGEKSVVLLKVTFEELAELVEIATGHTVADWPTGQLRGLAEDVESHLCSGKNVLEAIEAAL